MNKIQKKISKLSKMNLDWFKYDPYIRSYSYRMHKLIWLEEFRKKRYSKEYIIKTPLEKLRRLPESRIIEGG